MDDGLERLEQLRLLGLGLLPEPVKPQPPKSIGGWTIEPVELPEWIFEPIELPNFTIDEDAINKFLQDCIIDGEAILELLNG